MPKSTLESHNFFIVKNFMAECRATLDILGMSLGDFSKIIGCSQASLSRFSSKSARCNMPKKEIFEKIKATVFLLQEKKNIKECVKEYMDFKKYPDYEHELDVYGFKKRLKAVNVTVKDFAKMLQVSSPYLFATFSGQQSISKSGLFKMDKKICELEKSLEKV